jgi:hypothetical protein
VAVAVDSLITPEILKPARYLGNELGAVHKPWESATVRWALTYPEIYEVGASNLGHIILYSIINAQPRQLCVGGASRRESSLSTRSGFGAEVTRYSDTIIWGGVAEVSGGI